MSAEYQAARCNLFSPASLCRTISDREAGRLTCAEAVERCLERVSAVEGDIKALLHVDADGARTRAAEADRARRSGRRRALDGVAAAVKDVIDVRGMPTTAGSRVLDRALASTDSDIVSHLRDAGAIILGKANTHEFAFGATTPPTRNPNDTSRIAGGSSGGSAAAVAAGAAHFAVGTDTGGSVRLPAALCGIAGFRPRANPIGMGGIIPLAPEFDSWGLLAPSVADVEAVWTALGTESAGATAEIPRLIVPRHLSTTIADIDAEVAQRFGAVLAAAIDSGAGLAEVDIADLREWQTPRMLIQVQQALKAHRDRGWWPQRRDLYSDEVRINFELAEKNAGAPLDDARARLVALDREIDALLSGGAVLCLPTVPVHAPTVSAIARIPRHGEPRHPIVGLLARCTLPFSRTALASLTIPCRGVTGSLPVGAQLVATTNAMVLRTGRFLEDAMTESASGRL